jgi:hypothetical protein
VSFPSSQPSGPPSGHPTGQPTELPVSQPTVYPTSQPSGHPSGQPTEQPVCKPTVYPNSQPSSLPSYQPSLQPVGFPTSQPSALPTLISTTLPTTLPSVQPSALPTETPSPRPSSLPISSPSGFPTCIPTVVPSGFPSSLPSCAPSVVPSSFPSVFPSIQPSPLPSDHPSPLPSGAPSSAPSCLPTRSPTVLPSDSPLCSPTFPSTFPSTFPTGSPVAAPSVLPTLVPTEIQTIPLTLSPSSTPSGSPLGSPSLLPLVAPGYIPSSHPTILLTTQPSLRPSKSPIAFPLLSPTFDPSDVPSVHPVTFPSLFPSVNPSSSPTLNPSCVPISVPAIVPVSHPSSHPSRQPSKKLGMPTDSTLPAPLLLSVAYSDDGSFIEVLFDSPTNLGGFQLLSSFPCSTLLYFPCSLISKCQWSDTSTLKTYVKTSDECAKPGDIVKLAKEAKIKAACVVNHNNQCSNYDRWPVTNTTATPAGMKLVISLNPVLPTIVISTPSKLSWNCSSLIMDLTGSYGNGGRSWRNMSIVAGSDADLDLSKLQDFLNHKYQMNPPSAILPSYFPLPGVQYSFQVRMCNFLGSCSTARKSVLVVSEAIPVVRILSSTSSPVKTIRSQGLSLLSSASISSSCLDSVSSVDKGSMHYNWTTYLINGEAGQLQTTVVSTTKDLSRFLLSPYSLQSNKLYEIFLTVSSPVGFFQSSSASIQVVVGQGNLVIKIKGGTNERNIRVGESLSLDSTKSYDEDKGESTYGIEAGLLFEWSCIQLEPVLNRTSCAAIFEKPTGLISPIVSIKALSSADNRKAQWTLKVLDGSRSRSSSTSITVSILPLLSPTISLLSNALLGEGNGIMNAGQSLQITGNINIPAGVKSNATWTALGSSILSLSTLSLTPVSQQFPSFSSSYSSSKSSSSISLKEVNSSSSSSFITSSPSYSSLPFSSSLSMISILSNPSVVFVPLPILCNF